MEDVPQDGDRDTSPKQRRQRPTVDMRKVNLYKMYCLDARDKGFYPVAQEEIHEGIPSTRSTEALEVFAEGLNSRSISALAAFEEFYSTDEGSLWSIGAQSTNANIRQHEAAGRALAFRATVTAAEVRTVFLLRLRLTLVRAESMKEHYVALKLDRYMPKSRFKFIITYFHFDIDRMLETFRYQIAFLPFLLTAQVDHTEAFPARILVVVG